MNRRSLIALTIVLTLVAAVGIFQAFRASYTEAVTENLLKSLIRMHRYRVTYTDVINGTNVGGDPSVKKVTLLTLSGGDQILSMVANITTGFAIPTAYNVSAESVRAERGGVEVSTGDLMLPPDLSDVKFENLLGNAIETLFFSESLATDVVITVRSGDGSSLNNLTAGQVDFYVTSVR